MSGDCFSVLAILIIHMFDLALSAYDVVSIWRVFLKKYIYIGGENAGNFIFSFLGLSDIACIFA
jgi:hypothetical protein